LGQYRPQGSDFVWRDEALLRCVKNGGVIALVDLNMAQQQVIEGINSLFDHRGSLFVVELNQTFHKAPSFKPIVVLRNETGHGRKGLPNSFLNRFVKLSIPHVTLDVKLGYLFSKYRSLSANERIVSLIRRLLEQQADISIENIEFIIQFSENGLLNESL
jgi:midasin (ATPase involved in ribosome maturation)